MSTYKNIMYCDIIDYNDVLKNGIVSAGSGLAVRVNCSAK